MHRRVEDIAVNLLDRSDCALSVQTLNEFFSQATKSRKIDRLEDSDAFAMIELWRRFPIAAVDLVVFDLAIDVRRTTGYNWWDCLMVAAALSLGCDTLATEDLQHGRVIDGLRIVNPFRDAG